VVRTRKGNAVVKVEQGRCQGCHIKLSMNEWQKARTGVLVQCSSCGRILYLS
jgi:predicted  nucleic acid-binding Zn-ribbon protein